MNFGALNYAVVGLYLLLMLLIGVFLARRQKTTEDFFLAGRRMPWLAVAMSMYASLTSATTYLVLPGRAFSENISLIVVCIISPLLVPFLARWFYPFYWQLRVTTSYEYVGKRFGPNAHTTVSALFCLARLGWLGTVIYAPALAFSTANTIPLWQAILITGLLTTLYTMLGGLSAVIWTDVVQYIILIGGAIWVAIALMLQIPGGAAEILSLAARHGRLEIFSLRPSLTETTALIVALSFFLSLMQDYGTDQVTVQRLQAVRSFRDVLKAVFFNAGTDCCVIALLLFIGLGIFAHEVHFTDLAPALLTPDQMMPFYIMRYLPAGVSGLVMTGILAAAMSSLDSGLNSMATVIEKDFIQRAGWAPAAESGAIRRARWMTAGLGVLATATAFYVARRGNILETFIQFMSLFSAPILALFLLGMFSRRATFGAWVAGTVPAIAISWWVQENTALNWSFHYPLSFALAIGLGYLFCRLRPAPIAPAEYTLRGRPASPAKSPGTG